jgi:hypothetical protein
MNLGNKLRLGLCFFVVILPAGCATYQAADFANELTYLRQHPPSETFWMDDWDKEPWKRGFSGAALNEDVVEYVRPPETVENWTELLTMRVEWRTSKVYTHAGRETFAVVPDPLVVMGTTRLWAQQRCANPVAFRKLDEDRTGLYPSVIFYIACDKYPSATPPLPTAEADVYRVFQGKHGLHILIRARRSASLDNATLNEWTRYMKRFYLCDNRMPGQECGKKKS